MASSLDIQVPGTRLRAWALGFGLQAWGFGHQAWAFGLRASGLHLRAWAFTLQASGFILWLLDFELRAQAFILWVSGIMLGPSGFRFRPLGFRHWSSKFGHNLLCFDLHSSGLKASCLGLWASSFVLSSFGLRGLGFKLGPLVSGFVLQAWAFRL
ncbi:hypothetical protein AXF42_Ash013335 [Apostasia shenzhenica]|uniref:Uncharacterized protein n=1 Tax=Apostasia shenzhenica TaxID=1088818 RepID=A0A2I0BBN7_9ASPA|nr:hypothetical protein AXF42_Ash013335 [Apostasia shenzhenica]